MKPRRPAAEPFDEDAPRFLADLPVPRRAMALSAFQTRHRGINASEAAARLSAVLGFVDELDAEDFDHAVLVRDQSLARLLDASDISTLKTMAAKWSAPVERVLAEALRNIINAPPPVEILFDQLSLQL